MTQPIGYGEYVVSTVPFVVRRRVKWGDCDPAGMVYTVMFSEFVISTAELFYASLLGGPAYTEMTALGCTTPSRALSFDFQRSLSVDDEFDIVVRVAEIRTRTYVLELQGRSLTGEVLFVATLTPICMPPRERRAVEIPEVFRRKLEEYRSTDRRAVRDD